LIFEQQKPTMERGAILSFTILTQGPEDTFPLYMGVDQPQFKDRDVFIFSNPSEKQPLIAQFNSWGFKAVHSSSRPEYLRRLVRGNDSTITPEKQAPHPDLVIFDLSLLNEQPRLPTQQIRRLLMDIQQMQENSSPPVILLVPDDQAMENIQAVFQEDSTDTPPLHLCYQALKPVKAGQLYNLINTALADQTLLQAIHFSE